VDLQLEGNVVLVTGGSAGLGRAVAHGLVAEGARVVLCARDAQRLSETETALKAAGGEVEAVTADVREPDDLRRFLDVALDRFGRVDGLVNNAGASMAKPLADSTDEEWVDDLTVKVLAAVRLTRMALPALQASGGAVVNVLAVSAKAQAARSSPSSVSRAAGLGLTKTLSKELGSTGVRVNAVLVGFIRSAQWDRVAATTGRPVEDVYRDLAADTGIPLGRVGTAAEFADAVCYLLSRRASYVTGSALHLDGGLSPVA